MNDDRARPAAAIAICPPLDSERVTLHPLLTGHADLLFPILSDAELWNYAPRPRSQSADELRDRFARLESRRDNDGHEYWLNWVVEEKASRSVIGYVQATVDEALHEARVAYVLARAFWGRGLASDAVSAMLAHLRKIGVGTFAATVDSDNLRSVRLLEHLGFRVVDMQNAHDVRYALAAFDFVRIREESEDDALAISAAHRAAFGRDAEALLVERLRGDGLIVASVVSEADCEIVGSVVLSTLNIETGKGAIKAAALGPVAVLPGRQRRGTGTQMVEAGLRFCRDRGVKAVIVLGEPAYYSRFGFSTGVITGLKSKYAGPHWMGLELVPDSLQGTVGTVNYPPAFEVVD